jgi:hypothetical protein
LPYMTSWPLPPDAPLEQPLALVEDPPPPAPFDPAPEPLADPLVLVAAGLPDLLRCLWPTCLPAVLFTGVAAAVDVFATAAARWALCGLPLPADATTTTTNATTATAIPAAPARQIGLSFMNLSIDLSS